MRGKQICALHSPAGVPTGDASLAGPLGTGERLSADPRVVPPFGWANRHTMSRGQTVRFFIEDGAGRRSTTWRVWTTGRTADIYFAHREVAGELKGSLHESGSWQYGMTTERIRTAHRVRGWDGHSRHFMKWQRPPEITPGLTLAVEFGFPTNDLQVLPGVEREGCLAIPAAPRDEAVVVALFLSKPGADLRGRWPAEHDMG